MSRVTSAVIVVEFAFDEKMFIEPLNLSSVRPELREREKFVEVNYETPGGYKYLESSVFACAFNYVSPQEIENWFENLPWSNMDVAVLIIEHPEGGLRITKHDSNSQIEVRN